jgi:hypothetical protein
MVCALALLFTTSILIAQVVIRKGNGPNEMKLEGEPFNLGELGAVIMQEEGKVKVLHAIESNRRPEGYADIDLKTDDIIAMANGKKIQTTKDLKDLYDGLAIGAEVKLGIKRGEQMFIATFPKADANKLPKIQLRRMVGDDGGNMEVFPAVGVVLTQNANKQIIIVDKLPDSSSAVARANVKVNDQLLEMNGKRIPSLKSYSAMYDAIAVGATVSWKLKRSDHTFSISFAKPIPRGNFIRREIKK